MRCLSVLRRCRSVCRVPVLCLTVVCLPLLGFNPAAAQDKGLQVPPASLYQYETKPADEAFAKLNPALAPVPGPLLLRTGDRLAIIGDSITEQKMYSRIIENYLTMCVPHLKVTVRQYGWSGEKTDGFLKRMDQDCLSFQPTVATLCYGMNDARYRPYDATNGRWYRDHYTAIVQRFKQHGVRVVVGSPGCAGKLASWVKSRAGTLDEHNQHLCALRDIALEVASSQQVAFADIFWPMFQQQVLAPRKFSKTPEEYAVAGKDGIHPGWAGQVIMAYAFLTAMGLDGDLGTLNVDMAAGTATATGEHRITSFDNGRLSVTSQQYPYCSSGAIDADDSVRSGMALVPFAEKLNRFLLKVNGTGERGIQVTWGTETKSFTAAEARAGINLADQFSINPFSAAFERVDAAVLAKQSYETKQVKQIFHGAKGKQDFAAAVRETEAEREPLAAAIATAMVPIEHQLTIRVNP